MKQAYRDLLRVVMLARLACSFMTPGHTTDTNG